MKTIKKLGLTAVSILLTIACFTTNAQTFTVTKNASNMKIEGTSNIHDWEMEAEDLEGSLTAQLQNGQLSEITNLEFSVRAESLKSGKGGMDKNTYKALKTDEYKKITYTLKEVQNINCTSSQKCRVNTSGFLNIAGTKKPVEISCNAEVAANKIVLTGQHTIKMSAYNIDPPTAMFGTITTGDEVAVKFQITFSK